MISCEQQARELLDRMEVMDALELSNGDVVELANLISNHARQSCEGSRLREVLQAIADIPPVDAASESWCNKFLRARSMAKTALVSEGLKQND